MVGERPLVAVLLEPGQELPEAVAALADEADVHGVHGADGLAAVIDSAQVLAVYDFRSTSVRDLWRRAKRLRWLHAASAGLDAVLFPESEASDALITNSRGVFDRPIAEFVMAAMLAFAKDLKTTIELQARREWQHRESERLEGRHVLVVGAGSIGRAVARLARCAGMTVSGIARHERADDPDFGHVLPAERLRERLPEADFVVVSAPLTDETRGMLGRDEFAAFKAGARLINVGRGPIIQEEALVHALESGQLAGAALDVFDEEPLPPDNPLWRMSNVIVSPHMSGDFFGWREALAELFVENFRRWRRGDEMLNVVKEGIR